MAATTTPISAANLPSHSRLNPLSPPLSPSFIVKCSFKTSNNGAGRAVLDGFDDKATSTTTDNQETQVRKTKEYINQLESSLSETERKLIKKKKEKLESVKAASISAIVGTLASLPISLTHATNTYELTVSTAITIITCALYGATYRYTIRRDLDDFHLKTGTSAAFGIVKGVATLDGQTSLDALSGAICVSENVVIFLLAAAGLDICYKMGILSPFPLETRTKM